MEKGKKTMAGTGTDEPGEVRYLGQNPEVTFYHFKTILTLQCGVSLRGGRGQGCVVDPIKLPWRGLQEKGPTAGWRNDYWRFGVTQMMKAGEADSCSKGTGRSG